MEILCCIPSLSIIFYFSSLFYCIAISLALSLNLTGLFDFLLLPAREPIKMAYSSPLFFFLLYPAPFTRDGNSYFNYALSIYLYAFSISFGCIYANCSSFLKSNMAAAPDKVFILFIYGSTLNEPFALLGRETTLGLETSSP